MATKTGKKLTEEELNSPDLDDDGEVDVEIYPVPDAQAAGIDDPYLREVWDEAVRLLDDDEDENFEREARLSASVAVASGVAPNIATREPPNT